MSSFQSITDYGDDGYKVVIVASILILIQSSMIAGRLLSRHLQEVALAADDYVLFLATTIGFGLCALAIAFPRIAAFGPQIGMIAQVSESSGRTAGKSYVAWMVLYGLSIAAAKCAILLLYMRVFTSRMRVFTALSYVVGFVIIATCIANTFAAIFSCSPASYAWDKSIAGGKCIDQIAFARFMSIPNVVTGAAMLVMPLPLVWQLNVPVAAKVALTATFLHGILGFVASCARLSILFLPEHTSSMNTTSIAWTIWTLNEPANYVIAACLPTLRPIFIRVLPASFFLLSKQSSNKRSHNTSSIKISWPRGSLRPSFRLETNAMAAKTDSRLSGPWNGTRREVESDAERDIGLLESNGIYTQMRSVGSKDDADVVGKKLDAEENVVEVDPSRSM